VTDHHLKKKGEECQQKDKVYLAFLANDWDNFFS
jgi:hypothetical protein